MANDSHVELKDAAGAHRSALPFPGLHDPSRPVHRVADWLEPYLAAIVDKLHPEQIFLFGSYAYGTPTEHSDFGLRVVRRGIFSEKESNIEIRRSLRSVPGRRPSFTFRSETLEDLAVALSEHDPFIEGVLGKGLEVYAA